MVPFRAAVGGAGVEELLSGRGVGERDAERSCAREHEVQILLVQLDPEARVECALDHALAVHFEDARCRKAAEQRLPNPGVISARLLGKDECLGDGFNRQRHDDLVGGLARLARPVLADERDVLAQQIEERFCPLERGR